MRDWSQTKWTESELKSIQPTGAREVLRDPILPGHVLVMTPAGVKTFYLIYRPGGGRAAKQRWYKLGRLKTDIGLGTSRDMATKLRGKIRDGEDPQGERMAARVVKPGVTVAELCDRYLEVYVDKGQVAQSTGRNYRLHINSIIKPAIGTLAVAALTSSHIAKLLESLTPGQASHVRSTLNRLMTRAMVWEYRTSNPVKGHDKPQNPDKRVGHRLTPEEFRRLGKALHGATWHLRGLICTLALTGMRLGELHGATWGGVVPRPWSDVDLKAGTIHLPAKAHKTGKKAGARTVYLCPAAVKVLKSLPRENNSVLGDWHNAHRAWQDFRAGCGLDHVKLHDFRHTYISIADELVTPATRAVLVGHASRTMSDHYTHKANPELVKAAGSVGKVIAGLLGL